MEQPLELLLVASESKDPFATVIVDPKSCVSCWSYKGSELQGAETGCVEPVGQSGDLIFISARDQPLAHVLAVNGRDRFHLKSVLTNPLRNVAISKDGAVIFGSIDSRIFTWMVGTGELMSVVNAHFQEITCLCLSSDDGLLVSGASDGTVNVFLVSDLMSWDFGSLEVIKPLREWRVHSLTVTGLSVTCSANPRILSSSVDHTAALYSVTMDECLLKISGDRSITASCIDPAETCLFLGTDKGPIVQFRLYGLESTSEKMITFSGESRKEDLFFVGHIASITRLAVNHDASMLASGDSAGSYIIWDCISRQCLKSVRAKGSICKLQFIHSWESLRQSDYPKIKIPVGVLQRSHANPAGTRKITLKATNLKKNVDSEKRAYNHLSDLFRKQLELFQLSSAAGVNLANTENEKLSTNDGTDDVIVIEDADITDVTPSTSGNGVTDAAVNSVETENTNLKVKNAELLAEVKKLRAELASVKKKNREIFDFATDLILENKTK